MLSLVLWKDRLNGPRAARSATLQQRNLEWIVFFFGVAMAIRAPNVPLLFYRAPEEGGFGISPATMKLLQIMMFFAPRMLNPVMGWFVDRNQLWGNHRASYFTLVSEGIVGATLFLGLVVYYNGPLWLVVLGYVVLELLIAFLLVVLSSSIIEHARENQDGHYDHSIELRIQVWEMAGVAAGAMATGIGMHFLQTSADFNETFSTDVRIIPVPHTLPIREVTGVLYFASSALVLSMVYISAEYTAPLIDCTTAATTASLTQYCRCPSRDQINHYVPGTSRRLLLVIALDALAPDIDTLRMSYAIQVLDVHMAFPSVAVVVESLSLVCGIAVVNVWYRHRWSFRKNWILGRAIRVITFGVLSVFFYSPSVFPWPAEVTLAVTIFIDTFVEQSGNSSQNTLLSKFAPRSDTATGISVLRAIAQMLRGVNTVITVSVLYLTRIQGDRYDNVGHYTLGSTIVMLVTMIIGAFVFTSSIEQYTRPQGDDVEMEPSEEISTITSDAVLIG